MRSIILRSILVGAAMASAVPALAVYAPIPEGEQGDEFTYALRAGITYDSNIFGGASGQISSTIFEVSPDITFNYSASQTTFLSLEYKAIVDYYTNRPGNDILDSHYLTAKVAKSFSKTSDLFVTEAFSYVRNPQSTLNGLPINTDQSFVSNSLDGRFSFAPTEETTVALKGQDIYTHYLNSLLSNELDSNQDMEGLEGDYALRKDLKAAAEYRHQDVTYAHNGSVNDKNTDFAMGGLDYVPGPKTTFGFRLGGEYRTRSGASSITTPYAELTSKYAYAKDSFVSFGYTYDLEETSDPIHFTDEKVNRFTLNVQHALSALIVASASIDYETATLLGRANIGQANVSEDTTRGGLALTYIPTKNWLISATYDYDFVDSGIASRGMVRSRTGASATYTF